MFAKLIEAIFKDRSGYVGRKLIAAWALTFLITLILVVPFILSILGLAESTSFLITSDNYTSTLSIIWATYFASNSVNHWTYEVGKKDEDKDA